MPRGPDRIRKGSRGTELRVFSAKGTSLAFKFKEKLLKGFKYKRAVIYILRPFFWWSCVTPGREARYQLSAVDPMRGTEALTNCGQVNDRRVPQGTLGETEVH